jgi:hypothetical protein
MNREMGPTKEQIDAMVKSRAMSDKYYNNIAVSNFRAYKQALKIGAEWAIKWMQERCKTPEVNQWISAKDEPEQGEPVLGFNKEWISEYNPKGVRECFIDGLGWHSAKYNNLFDSWDNVGLEDLEPEPTHWMPLPSPPKH